MSKPDARVSLVQRYTPALNDSECMDGSKVASMDPYTMGRFVTYADYQKVESLLAEAEREIARLESSVFNVVTERNALQTRLDGVVWLADSWAAKGKELNLTGPAVCFANELRAALGGE